MCTTNNTQKFSANKVPLLSLRASAAWIVVDALPSRLRSSRVSIRSVFQMSERSVTFTSLKDCTVSSISLAPRARVSCKENVCVYYVW